MVVASDSTFETGFVVVTVEYSASLAAATIDLACTPLSDLGGSALDCLRMNSFQLATMRDSMTSQLISGVHTQYRIAKVATSDDPRAKGTDEVVRLFPSSPALCSSLWNRCDCPGAVELRMTTECASSWI
jgi:hypothetical protein